MKFVNPVRLLAAVTAAGLLVATLGACGDASGNSGGPASSSDGSAVTSLTVAVSPGAPTSTPMYLAVKNGVFAKHHLDVQLTVLQNGSVAIPQTMNGQTQFSMASFAPVAHAVSKGLPVKVVGAVNVIPTDPNTKYQAIIVRDGINSITEVTTFAAASTETDPVQALAVDKLGGDYAAMKLLAVPFAGIADAVRDGNADAALVTEPFLSKALAGGGVKVLSYVGPEQSLPGTPGAVFIGSDAYMSEHPDITKEFVAATQEAYEYAQAHLDEVAAFVPQTGLSDQSVPVVALGEYQQGPLQPAKVTELLNLFQKYGVLDASVTADKMMYRP